MPNSNPLPRTTLPWGLQGWRGLIFAALTFVLIFILASWLPDQGLPPNLIPSGEQEKVLALQPTSTASTVTWQVFSKTGQLSYEIGATKLQQFAHQRYATIGQPTMQIQDRQLRPWQIVAAQGRVSHANTQSDNGDVLELLGDVRVTQIHQQNLLTDLRVETSQLSIYPNRKRAFTMQPVVVTHSRFVTEANGLDLDLETGTLRFATGDATRVVSRLFLNNPSEDS